jgi:hypothetical protein
MRPHRLEPALRLPTRRNNPLYDPQAAFGGSFTAVGMAAEMTVTGPAVTVGKVAIINKDAIVIQAMSIELLLREVIDREKEARSNSGVLPEIEAVLAEVHDLRATLVTTTSEVVAGTKALSFKAGVLKWWDKDHESILSLGYKSSLFILLMGLIVYFGLIPATIAATLLNKDVGDALKQLVKLLQGGG